MTLRTPTLRSRLVLLSVAGAAAVLVGAAVLLYLVVRTELRSAVDDGLQARSRDLEAVMRENGGAIPDQDPFALVLTSGGDVLDTSAGAAGSVDVLSGRILPPVGASIAEDRTVPALGGDARLLVRTIDIGGQPYVLAVGESLDEFQRTQEKVGLALLVGGPLVIALLSVGGWLLAGAALRPVREITQEAEEISLTELGRRLPVPAGEDELAQLARTLNAMLERIEESIGHERRFIDDASHELRTPITILRGELELALAQGDDPVELRDAVRSALDEADRLSRLASDLLVLARARAGELDLRRSDIDLSAIAETVCDQLRTGSSVKLTVVGPTVTAFADPDRLVQVLVNLVGNARRYAAREVRVVVSRRDGCAEVLVADDGPGFSPSMLPVSFERFSRPDASRARDTGGTGLGLSISAALVRSHRGRIEAGNDGPLGGAWVRVTLPVPSGSAVDGRLAPPVAVGDDVGRR